MAKYITYDELMKLAMRHYNEGGDAIYECWDQRTFDDYVAMFGPMTKAQALRMFTVNNDIEKEEEAQMRINTTTTDTTTFDIQAITPDEVRLAYTNTEDPANCIGHLRGALDLNGCALTSWFDHHRELKTSWFKEEFQAMFDHLRGTIAKTRGTVTHFAWTEAGCPGGRALRLDDGRGSVACKVVTDRYTYIIRLCPEPGDYNVYVYCYTHTLETLADFIEVVKVEPRQPWQGAFRVYTYGIHEATLDTLEEAKEYAQELLDIYNDDTIMEEEEA